MELPSLWGSSVMVTMGAAISSPTLPFSIDMPSSTILAENTDENTERRLRICLPSKTILYFPEGTSPAPILEIASSTALLTSTFTEPSISLCFSSSRANADWNSSPSATTASEIPTLTPQEVDRLRPCEFTIRISNPAETV